MADLVVQFMEVTGADHAEAVSLLEAADDNLDNAIALFFAKNDGPSSAPANNLDALAGIAAEEDVRAPLPVRTERLMAPAPTYHRPLIPPPQLSNPFRDFHSEASTDGGAGLGDLFKPPHDLLFPLSTASLDEAVNACLKNNKWLMVNVQANDNFASHQLNRDTWSDAALSEIIKINFVFVQVMAESAFGQSVCGAYRLTETPTVMVVDPETRAKVKQWTGFIAPDRLVEELLPFLEHAFNDAGASSLAMSQLRHKSSTAAAPTMDAMTEDEQLAMALAMSAEGGAAAQHQAPPQNSVEEVAAAPLDTPEQVQRKASARVPTEPAEGVDGVVRIGFRLPDGRRLQRRFLVSTPLQALYDFCLSESTEAAAGRSFALADSVPGSPALVDKEITVGAAGDIQGAWDGDRHDWGLRVPILFPRAMPGEATFIGADRPSKHAVPGVMHSDSECWFEEEPQRAMSFSCRICYKDADDSSAFISPCKCTGTQKYVCAKCLRRWQDNLLAGKNKNDIRAFRCNVCCTRFSLQPRTFGATPMHWLRAIGGALWLVMLAFGMSSSPWPHMALLGVLLFGMVRSPRGPPTLTSLACLCLLLAAAFLALLQLRGLRMVMRLDGEGKLGMALIHHGPSVQGLAPGCVLVASEDMHDGGIFARSVVLITDHSPTRGTRGVVITAPLHGLQDPFGPSGALRHMVGGPVGAPGSSQPEEVLLHTATGVTGARQLLPVLPIGPPPPPPALQLRGPRGWVPREQSAFSAQARGMAVQGGDRGEVQRWLQQGTASAWLFYGVAAWARGQLEGELRAGLWGMSSLTAGELQRTAPEKLWTKIMMHEPHRVRFLNTS